MVLVYFSSCKNKTNTKEIVIKRVGLFENRPALYFCNYKDKKYTYVGYHNHIY